MADNDPDWEQKFALIEPLLPTGHSPLLARKKLSGVFARMMPRSTIHAR